MSNFLPDSYSVQLKNIMDNFIVNLKSFKTAYIKYLIDQDDLASKDCYKSQYPPLPSLQYGDPKNQMGGINQGIQDLKDLKKSISTKINERSIVLEEINEDIETEKEEINELEDKLQKILNSNNAAVGMIDEYQFFYNKTILYSVIISSLIILLGYLSYKHGDTSKIKALFPQISEITKITENSEG
jgi:hypothetical protein